MYYKREKLSKVERRTILVRETIRRRMGAKEVKMEARGEILHVLTARGMIIQRNIVGLGQMCNAGHASNLVI